MKKRNAGFTLVEIMIVVAIIGLLAAIGIPAIMNSKEKSRETDKQRNIADVEKAKAALQRPDGTGAGIDATNGQTVTEAEVLSAMTGVSDLDDLNVGGDSISVNPIGTPASY